MEGLFLKRTGAYTILYLYGVLNNLDYFDILSLYNIMSLISSLSHHATLFVHHSRTSLTEKMWEELHRESLAHTLHNHTVFDIDTARDIQSWASSPYNGKKIALLSFHTMTLPAQNALLKILEDPYQGVQFILVTSNSESLIPTLRSRLQEQLVNMSDTKKFETEAKIFLSTEYKERMKIPCITKLLNAVDEEDRKDRESIRSFIFSLAFILGGCTECARYTIITLEMASYAGDTSASGKNILEYLALLLPKI